MRRWTMGNLRYVADLFLPPICIRCHEPISAHGVLCAACWQGINFIMPPLCGRLGLPLPYASGEDVQLSSMALRHPPVYGRARAAAQFDGVMRDLVHSLKYADRHEAVDLFGRMLCSAGTELLRDADLLMPVPLHRARLWKRRFNQAAILAGRVSASGGHSGRSERLAAYAPHYEPGRPVARRCGIGMSPTHSRWPPPRCRTSGESAFCWWTT